jgi:hypothetical protein
VEFKIDTPVDCAVPFPSHVGVGELWWRKTGQDCGASTEKSALELKKLTSARNLVQAVESSAACSISKLELTHTVFSSSRCKISHGGLLKDARAPRVHVHM